jgi:hypothetical protein
MEHILEDVQVFRNFHRSLKQGGMLLISTPSDQGGSDVHGEGEASFIEEHVRDGYNIKDIEDKLRSAVFRKWKLVIRMGLPKNLLASFHEISDTISRKSSPYYRIPDSSFYYLIAYPIFFCAEFFRYQMKHPTGTGLIVKAWK